MITRSITDMKNRLVVVEERLAQARRRQPVPNNLISALASEVFEIRGAIAARLRTRYEREGSVQ